MAKVNELLRQFEGNLTRKDLERWELQRFIFPERIEKAQLARREYSPADVKKIELMVKYRKQGLPPVAAHKKAEQELVATSIQVQNESQLESAVRGVEVPVRNNNEPLRVQIYSTKPDVNISVLGSRFGAYRFNDSLTTVSALLIQNPYNKTLIQSKLIGTELQPTGEVYEPPNERPPNQ